MKTTRKVIYFILALLPMLVLITYCIGSIGDASVEPQEMPTIVLNADGSITVPTDANALYEPLWGLWTASADGDGLFNVIGRALYILNTQAGFPASTPVILMVCYVAYLVCVEFVMILFDVVTLVPRFVRRWIEQ